MSKLITKLLIIIILLGVLPLAASLRTGSSRALVLRNDVVRGGIYYCSGKSFGNPCRWQYINPEDRKGQTCVWLHLPEGGGILSVGPDWGIEVDIFTNSGCTGPMVTGPLTCPGWVNMANFEGQGYNVKSPDLWVRVTEIPRERLASPNQQASDRIAGCPNSPYVDKNLKGT